MTVFWTYFFAIANMVIILISAYLISSQIKKQHEWNRRKQSCVLIDKFTSQNMRELRYEFEKSVGDVFKTDTVSWDVLDESARNNLRTLLNFFEDVAIAICHGAADEEMLFCYFDFLIPRYFAKYHMCIESMRIKANNRMVYAYFEDLAQRWSSKDKSYLRKNKL